MALIGKDRIITALFGLPLVAAAVVLLPVNGFYLLVAALSAIGCWELYRFHFGDRLPATAWVGTLVAAMVVLGIACAHPLAALVLGTVVMLLVRMGSGREMETALTDVAVTLLGVLYVGVLLSHLGLLKAVGYPWVFYLMLVTWANDAGAYYTGKLTGKTRLTGVSPNKTVEGTLGGMAIAVAAAYLGMLFVPGLCLWDPLRIGLLLGVMALLGDLVESLFKRGAGVKDSSNLIPAHGGLMDKLDAFLFTAPALYYYLSYVVWRG